MAHMQALTGGVRKLDEAVKLGFVTAGLGSV